jgi:hypothetical protein
VEPACSVPVPVPVPVPVAWAVVDNGVAALIECVHSHWPLDARRGGVRDRGRGAGLGGLPDWHHAVLTAVRLSAAAFLAFVSLLCPGRQDKRFVFNMLCFMTCGVRVCVCALPCLLLDQLPLVRCSQDARRHACGWRGWRHLGGGVQNLSRLVAHSRSYMFGMYVCLLLG